MRLVSKFTDMEYNIFNEDDTYYYYQGQDDIKRRVSKERYKLFFILEGI